MIFQVFVSTTTKSLRAGFGRRTETNIFVPSIEKPTWNGDGNSPVHSGSRTNVLRFHFRGSLSVVSKIAMLLARRLFIIVKTDGRRDGLKPDSWIGLLTARSEEHTSELQSLRHL